MLVSYFIFHIFVVVQSLSCVWLSATPWTAAHQAPLTFTISWSLLKLTSVMLSKHLILCYPPLLWFSIFASIRVFFNALALHIRWPKYWSFSISPSNEYSGLIPFRVDWFDLLAVQGTLKNLFKHHSLKAPVLLCLAFFMGQLSHPYMTAGKITADGDCCHEIKRRLLLARRAMTNSDSILKSRDITLPTKVHIVKAMVFSVVMYRCESWIIKKVERQRIDAFKLWCWRRFLRVPWTARRSNQPIHNRDQPWDFFGRTGAKVFTPVLWPPHAKGWLIGKDSDAGKDWGQEEKGMTEDEMAGWHHWLDGGEFEWNPGVGDGLEAWHAAIHGVRKSGTQLSDWTELNRYI